MLEQILSFIHHVTTMLFGIYISAFFLGVKPNRKSIVTLFLFVACEEIFYSVGLILFGMAVTYRFYEVTLPVLVQLTLIAFLSLYYKYSVISSCISVFSTYLCCQLSNWVGLLILTITGEQVFYYGSRILTTVLVFVFLCRFVCRTTETIFTRDTRELYIIGF